MEEQEQSREGFTYKIKNPVDQARKGKYAMLEKLRSMSSDVKSGRHRIRIDYGVIFPGSGKVEKDLGADMPVDIFAFGDDMPRLGAWVESRFEQLKNSKGQSLDGKLLDGLHKLLAQSFELKVRLWTEISAEREKIVILTDEQIRILDDLDINKRIAIPGPAGSGKTLMAIEKARRLASQSFKTLFLCFNRPLAMQVSRHVDCDHLDVMTFHQLCHRAASKLGITEIFDGDSWPEANELETCMLEYLSGSSDVKYDAIVVDEGQDFRPEWWDIVELMLNEPESGIFYVFYDDNQKIYSWSGVPAPSLPRSYRLSRNIRNTKEIFRVAIKHYKGNVVHSLGPDGRPVQEIDVSPNGSVHKELREVVGDLIANKGIPAHEIAVLTESRKQSDEASSFLAQAKTSAP